MKLNIFNLGTILQELEKTIFRPAWEKTLFNLGTTLQQ